jgi:hypothetical protein
VLDVTPWWTTFELEFENRSLRKAKSLQKGSLTSRIPQEHDLTHTSIERRVAFSEAVWPPPRSGNVWGKTRRTREDVNFNVEGAAWRPPDEAELQ